jgi:Na+-driven multidrug efflux pump
LALAFFGILAVLYLTVPKLFIYPFTLNGGLADLENSVETIVVLLRFIAFFCLFDAIFLVFLGALEGAGDTRFIMKMSIVISIFLLIIPCYLYIRFFEATLIGLWWIITINVVIYCLVFYWRFKTGPWKSMRVIDGVE